MSVTSKVFAFKLAERKPEAGKWKAREGVSVAGCTHVEDGRYWAGSQYCSDCWYEC